MTDFSGTPYLETKAPPAARERGRYEPGRRNPGTAYRAARRHSVVVRSLRFVLPALALCGLAVFWFSARFVSDNMPPLTGAASIDVSTKSVTMQKPHLSGFDGTRRAYQVNADTAIQSLDDPKMITLAGIVGHFGLNDGQDAVVRAVAGLYNARSSYLTLTEGITATTSRGYTAQLIDAWVDIHSGKLVTKKPVILTSNDETVRASAMTVIDSGKQIFFSGGVSVTYTAHDPTPPAAVAEETQP